MTKRPASDELEQFEAAQRETDALLQILNAHAIISITDRSGRLIEVNDAFCALTGYTRAELLGGNPKLNTSGVHSPDFWAELWQTITAGRIWHGEICNRRKDGSLYWVDTTIVPHISEQGKADSYTSIRFDITERKQLEVDLRASKEHLKRIADLDPLTNLPNRRRFQEFVQTIVGRHTVNRRGFHLALLDVDTFMLQEVMTLFS